MRFLDYVEVDYNMPLRQNPNLPEGVRTWIARTSEVRTPAKGEIVAIGDGEIDGGGVTLGRIIKVDPEVRTSTGEYPFVYVWVSPIDFEIIDKGLAGGY